MMMKANTNKEKKAEIDEYHSERPAKKRIALLYKHFHVSNAIMKTMMMRNSSVENFVFRNAV